VVESSVSSPILRAMTAASPPRLGLRANLGQFALLMVVNALVGGMLVQAGAIAVIAFGSTFGVWLLASATLGLGTAMVYPTLLAAIADVADPVWRGSAIGVYRPWRDLGFAFGALLAGLLADRYGMPAAIAAMRRSRPAPGWSSSSGCARRWSDSRLQRGKQRRSP
jgi:MFS family permease